MKGMRQRASVLAVAIAASAGGIAIGNAVGATDYTSTVNAYCVGSHSEQLSGSTWRYKGQINNCLGQDLYLRMDIASGADSSNKYTRSGSTASWDWFVGGTGGFTKWKGCTGAPCA